MTQSKCHRNKPKSHCILHLLSYKDVHNHSIKWTYINRYFFKGFQEFKSFFI